jgi:surface-anchored protein
VAATFKQTTKENNTMNKLRIALAMLTAVGLTSAATAQTTVSTGHVDIFGVGYVGGALELLIHEEASGLEFEPVDTVVQVNLGGFVLRPASAAFDFLGASGTSLWILPASEIESDNRGVIFAGVGTEEIDPIDWGAGTPITITLLSVVRAPAGGNFFLWSEDEFGNPTQVMNSTNLATYDSLTQAIGLHEHYNWGFTAEGIYEIEFQATGTPENGSPLSATQTYTFSTVPEPSTYALLGLGAGALALMRWRKRRRQS